jgi:TolB protein
MIDVPREFAIPEAASRRHRSILATRVESAHAVTHGRRRLIALAVLVLVGAMLVTPALAIGTRVVELLRGAVDRPLWSEVQTPVWSPDGRRLAFQQGRGANRVLYVVGSDGRGRQRLLPVASDAGPAWSPDGRMIAIEGRRGSLHDGIHVVRADGSGRRRLARRGYGPAWSPDGTKVAYALTSIHVIDADGTGHRALTRPRGRSSSPVWSPDGRRIAFLRSVGCDFCFHLVVADVFGSHERDLTPDLGRGTERALSVGGHAWSPDGRRIAFTTIAYGPGGRRPGDLHVVNVDGGGRRRLARQSPVIPSRPSWSPDGRQIAFTSVRDGDREVYLVTGDGSALRNLTSSPAADGSPSWSPDGRTIAFVSNRRGRDELLVMNADGTGVRRLSPRGG